MISLSLMGGIVRGLSLSNLDELRKKLRMSGCKMGIINSSGLEHEISPAYFITLNLDRFLQYLTTLNLYVYLVSTFHLATQVKFFQACVSNNSNENKKCSGEALFAVSLIYTSYMRTANTHLFESAFFLVESASLP